MLNLRKELYVDDYFSFEKVLEKYNEIVSFNKEVYGKEIELLKGKKGVEELSFEYSYKSKLKRENKQFNEEEFNKEFEEFCYKIRQERIQKFDVEFEKNTELELLFDVSKLGKNKDSYSYVCEVMNDLKSLNINYKKVSFQMMNEDIDFNEKIPNILTLEELNDLKFLEKYLVENNLCDRIFLQEGKKAVSLTIEEVENANKFVDYVVEDIKRMELSPFETAVYVHDFCSSFFYNEKDKSYNSRTLGDVVSSGNIVCVGYATMYKAIIDKINDGRIKAKLNVCFVSGFLDSGHANNMVYVNDEKYGIKGTYMEDSCWSAPGFSPNEKNTLTYCLYPVEDVNFANKKYLYLTSYEAAQYYETAEVLDIAKDSDQEKYEKEHECFLDSIIDKGEAISFEKYCDAYCSILQKKGYSKEEIEKMIESKISASIFVARTDFKEGCKNSFYKDVLDEFMENQETELTKINKQLKKLAKIFNEETDNSEKYIVYQQILRLKEDKRKIIDRQEEKYVPNNKAIISNILNKKK